MLTNFGQIEKWNSQFPDVSKNTTWQWKMEHIIRVLDLNFNHKQ